METEKRAVDESTQCIKEGPPAALTYSNIPKGSFRTPDPAISGQSGSMIFKTIINNVIYIFI